MGVSTQLKQQFIPLITIPITLIQGTHKNRLDIIMPSNRFKPYDLAVTRLYSW